MKECPICGKQWPDEASFCGDDATPLPSAGADEGLKGKVVGHYKILGKLGGGGMGNVYLAEHLTLHRKDAIKVLNRTAASDPDALARFNREARNASHIRHHNVCAVYDFGETSEGLTFLAMEFIEGLSLSEILEEAGGTLDPARAAQITQKVAEGLQAAHNQGIVHRDLKPGNIMIGRNQDGSESVKVVDFGIAKAAGGHEGQEVTRMGLVAGTPEYMSPEHLAGDEPDPRSDIYSLAVVLFRMLAGELPFKATTQSELLKKRLTEDPMSLLDARPDLHFSPALQQVLDTALHSEPGQRYASAREFGRAVVQASAGAPPVTVVVEERPEPVSPEAIGFRLSKGWIGGAVAAAAVTATVVGVAIRMSGPAPLSQILVDRATATIAIGASTQLSATPADADGQPLADIPLSWRSDDPEVAEVDATGRVTGLRVGITSVWATAGEIDASVAVSVGPKPASEIALNPPSLRLTVGRSGRLEAVVRDADGIDLPDAEPTWRSSAPSVARVDPGGRVEALAAGSAVISAFADGVEGQSGVTVVAAGGGGGGGDDPGPRITADEARETILRLASNPLTESSPRSDLRRAREEARAVWNAGSLIPAATRSIAAQLVGQYSSSLGEREEGLVWLERSLRANPGNTAARALYCAARPDDPLCTGSGQP